MNPEINLFGYSRRQNSYPMNSNYYTTQAAKWKAYQLLDPFADGLYFVGYPSTRTFCCPSCDFNEPVKNESEVVYFTQSSEALDSEYTPCGHCNPLELSYFRKNLMMMCVDYINQSINFNPPSDIFQNTKKENTEDDDAGTSGTSNNHIVVIIACRHIAFAAINSYFASSIHSPLNTMPSSPTSPASTFPETTTKRRRKRGGVVGFKELAAKSRLSPWHFHRVFKSITGLTPKSYGDKCSDFIKLNADSEKENALTTRGDNSEEMMSFSDLNELPERSTDDYLNTSAMRHSFTGSVNNDSVESQMFDNLGGLGLGAQELKSNISPISSAVSSTTLSKLNQLFGSEENYIPQDQLLDLDLLDYVKPPEQSLLDQSLPDQSLPSNTYNKNQDILNFNLHSNINDNTDAAYENTFDTEGFTVDGIPTEFSHLNYFSDGLNLTQFNPANDQNSKTNIMSNEFLFI